MNNGLLCVYALCVYVLRKNYTEEMFYFVLKVGRCNIFISCGNEQQIW